MLKPHNLDELLALVRASSKNKQISPDLIAHIGTQELERRRNLKEAVKSTKNKLHQIGGAYLDVQAIQAASQQWLYELQKGIQSNDNATLQAACAAIMGYHASTRERLPMLATFYSTIFADLPPITSIIDIACGLNPLAFPWMPLSPLFPEQPQQPHQPLQPALTYYAYDIYQHITDLLQAWFDLLPLQGYAYTCDVLQQCPTQSVDVALILKAIPCLEQIDKQAGYHLLRTLNARHLIVSFPLQSLGGKRKGMLTHYEAQFNALVAGEPWSIKRYEFATELVYVITK